MTNYVCMYTNIIGIKIMQKSNIRNSQNLKITVLFLSHLVCIYKGENITTTPATTNLHPTNIYCMRLWLYRENKCPINHTVEFQKTQLEKVQCMYVMYVCDSNFNKWI